MKRNRIWMTIVFILGVICIGYFIMYITMVGMNNTFTWFWLLAGGVLIDCDILWYLLDRQGHHLPVWAHHTLLAVIGVGTLVFVVVEGILIGYGGSKPDAGADYVIVLGARVNGAKPSYNLEKRIRKAYRYLNDNPKTRAVLSGGKGPGEDISEAQAMYTYLTELGIAKERLILEDKSVNTDQNLQYSRDKISDPQAKVVIVSNQFHIFRATRIAKKKGFTHVQGMGTGVKWYTVPNMYVREAFAVLKYALCGQI